MNITNIILALLLPFSLIGLDCELFPIDTANVCGYEFELSLSLEEGTLNYDCIDDQFVSITYGSEATNLAFSSCGVYEIIYDAPDGSCSDTLLIQVSDPNSLDINQNTAINLGYGAIDCPGNVNADCYSNSVSISISTGTPTPIWSFCSTTSCQTTIYSADTVGNVTGCFADSVVVDTIGVFSTENSCSDTTQNAFIVLDSAGDTVVDNNFLAYLNSLQNATNQGCAFPGSECSFSNIPGCLDSTIIDTTILPIPVRIGGQWTMPMIDTLQLLDTTYFTYFGKDYELILSPGVDFYGPGELMVELSEIFITGSNDTIRNYPEDFYLTLQWEEEWIIDTLLYIEEIQIDTDDDCFSCGEVNFSGGFNIPGIPDFPCGPVNIYYPPLCECIYNEPNYSIQVIECSPREWQFDLLSSDQYISSVYGANAEISQNSAILSVPTSQNIEIESYDFGGCNYFTTVYLEDFLQEMNISSSGALSCENGLVYLSVAGSNYFSGESYDLSNTMWSTGDVGTSIVVNVEGTYSATYTDDHGCEFSVSIYVDYDETINCDDDSNPQASENCEFSEMEILCEIITFDSFEYWMPDQNSSGEQPQPLCDGGAAHNISWFSFVAFSGDYSINILPSGCFGSSDGTEGIQVGMYDDCSFSNPAYCNSTPSTNEVSISSDFLEEGQVYHMFIDGNLGSICHYEIDISGNPEPPNLAPNSMSISANGQHFQNANNSTETHQFCIGEIINVGLDGIDILGEYSWTTTTIDGTPYSGEPNTITDYNGLSLPFYSTGTYEICINEIDNGCDEFTWQGQMCSTIEIIEYEDEFFGTYFICDGELESFDSAVFSESDPNNDGTFGIQADLENLQIGLNTFQIISSQGCLYDQHIELAYFPSSDIPSVHIVECYTSLPFEVGGHLLTEDAFESTDALTFDVVIDESDVNGCDSTMIYAVEIIRFQNEPSISSSCTADGIVLNFSEFFINPLNGELITFSILDPNGLYVATDLNTESYIIPHGSSDGIYTIQCFKSKEGATCELSIETSLIFSNLTPKAPEISDGPIKLCGSEGLVTYVATSEEQNIHFVWSVDGNSSTFTSSGEFNQTLFINWNGSGGSLSVLAVNECGLENGTAVEISLFDDPELFLVNEEETCQGNISLISLDVDEAEIDSYDWDFNGGTIVSGDGPGPFEIIWGDEGSKTISLSTVDINGCEHNIESEIMVNDVPVADFSTLTDSICLSDPLNINVLESMQGTAQIWDFSGGTNIGLDDPVIFFDSPGWKTITYIVSNGLCSSELSKAVYVEAEMEEIEIACMNQGLTTLLFEWNAVEGADGYLVAIDNQPAIEVLGNTFLAENLEENTGYSINVSVITDRRCPPPNSSFSCSTNECIPIEFSFETPEMICITDNMEKIELVAIAAGVEEEFSWDGQNVEGTFFDPNGLEEGLYTFVISHELEGCISTDNIDIELVAPPVFDLMYNDIVCFGDKSINLEIQATDDTYTYFVDGENVESTLEISPGEHEILVVNSKNCSTYKTITIEELEEQEIGISGEIEIKEGENHTYSLDPSLIEEGIDINSILWIINGSEYCVGSDCTSINVALTDDSQIELLATTHEGCEVYSTLTVFVEKKEPILTVPNVFSPNGDGANDFWFVIPNIEEVIIERISIIDRWNNLVYDNTNGPYYMDMKWDGKFNGQNLQPGVYVYTVQYSYDDAIETIYGDVTLVK